LSRTTKKVLPLELTKYLIEFALKYNPKRFIQQRSLKGDIMKRSAALFPVAPAAGAVTLAPWTSAQAQDSRQEGPIEIEKCRTIDKPGSHKLVNNLTGPFDGSGNCLVIIASFVAILPVSRA
jgi:hypothetical protein